VVETAHVVGKVYVIMDVPADIPFTTPLALSIVATAVVAEPQLPPAGVLDKLVVAPVQTLVIPLIAVGNEFTVTV
jgi:hypothetical protein